MVNNLKREAANFKVRWSGASGFYFFTLGLNVQELELQSRGEGVEKRGDGGECFFDIVDSLVLAAGCTFSFCFCAIVRWFPTEEKITKHLWFICYCFQVFQSQLEL